MSVTINGVVYEGDCVSINNGKITIDGNSIKTTSSSNSDITIIGNVDSITTTNGDVTVTGNVGSVQTVNGDVKGTTISGNIKTTNGSVSGVKEIIKEKFEEIKTKFTGVI